MIIVYRLVSMLQLMLYCQPDAKVANGMFWFNFWLDLAMKVIN